VPSQDGSTAWAPSTPGKARPQRAHGIHLAEGLSLAPTAQGTALLATFPGEAMASGWPLGLSACTSWRLRHPWSP
jgi:hypothetical protein